MAGGELRSLGEAAERFEAGRSGETDKVEAGERWLAQPESCSQGVAGANPFLIYLRNNQ
jgi:hypothetical protein